MFLSGNVQAVTENRLANALKLNQILIVFLQMQTLKSLCVYQWLMDIEQDSLFIEFNFSATPLIIIILIIIIISIIVTSQQQGACPRSHLFPIGT